MRSSPSEGGSSNARPIRRAFLALEPPPVVLDALEPHVEGLRSSAGAVRWTTRAQWHLTLQFLGRVGDLDALLDAVRRAATATAPFEAQLGHGGAFPRPARASTLWVGLVRGAEALTALAESVAGQTARLGFEADAGFHPHLTLARAKQRRDLRPVVDAIGREPVGPSWRVTELVLFESDTRPDGARYTPVSRVPLQG